MDRDQPAIPCSAHALPRTISHEVRFEQRRNEQARAAREVGPCQHRPLDQSTTRGPRDLNRPGAEAPARRNTRCPQVESCPHSTIRDPGGPVDRRMSRHESYLGDGDRAGPTDVRVVPGPGLSRRRAATLGYRDGVYRFGVRAARLATLGPLPSARPRTRADPVDGDSLHFPRCRAHALVLVAMRRTAIRLGARRTPVCHRPDPPAGRHSSATRTTRLTTGFTVGLAADDRLVRPVDRHPPAAPTTRRTTASAVALGADDRLVRPVDRHPPAAPTTRRTTGLAVGLVAAIALHSSHPASAAPTGEFDWPLRPRPHVERRFDKPARDWLPGHRGVDLAGVPGQDVLAAGAGIVVFAGEVAGRPVVSIDHPGGLRTTYEPVRARVSIGSRVGRGSRIGELDAGHEGCAAAACLHWGLRREAGAGNPREYLDPLALLHLSPLRLKPVGAR